MKQDKIMEFSSTERDLVTNLFFRVHPVAAEVAEMFYARLFELDPSAQELFSKTNMADQGAKLIQTLGAAAESLINPKSLAENMLELGKRHAEYGVVQEQYQVMRKALTWAMEQKLGDDFTPETKAAWLKTYDFLASEATKVYN